MPLKASRHGAPASLAPPDIPDLDRHFHDVKFESRRVFKPRNDISTAYEDSNLLNTSVIFSILTKQAISC